MSTRADQIKTGNSRVSIVGTKPGALRENGGHGEGRAVIGEEVSLETLGGDEMLYYDVFAQLW